MNAMTRPVAFGIAALAVGIVALVAFGYGAAGEPLDESPEQRRRKRWLALAVGAGWLALTGAIGASGVLMRFDQRPAPLMVFFVAAFVVGVALGVSRVGERLGRGLPLATLVGFHGFRLPLELVMHQGYEAGLVPLQMTFSGYNFDILSGVSALVLALVLSRRSVPLLVVRLWNAAAAALLLIIVGIAAASTPIFQAFGGDPGQLNTWVARFPYQWMGPVMVMAALTGHIVLARRLRWESAEASSSPDSPEDPTPPPRRGPLN